MTVQPTRDQLRALADAAADDGYTGNDDYGHLTVSPAVLIALLDQLERAEAERDAARGYVSELETAVQSRNDVIKHRDTRIKAVRELHIEEPGVGTAYCIDCEQPMPCDTIRALDPRAADGEDG